ncbi:GNAT family N-acetyltransferase [Bacillus horti]|uniref:GNAT superfamily N-acetyltransferase n=1 Tax=Caldalkalibacillus horti TaxID=77523 RepID=A0ABT9VZL5_9BACI|nr:GNAT family N-acetyltransferase [Bacillus horti]MDQ0166295.1 GNAT superfamily N-acetyltransferase [Bacillus horti]
MTFLPLTYKYLDQILDLWNRELGKDFPLSKALLEQNSFLDQNVFNSGSWVCLEEHTNTVKGFIVSKLWQEKVNGVNLGEHVGWIQMLLVDSSFRNQGIGTSLLEKAENAFKAYEKQIKQVFIGRDPWHYFPGIPKQLGDATSWFEQRGYSSKNQVHDLYRNMDQTDQGLIPLPQIEKVKLRLLQRSEKEELLAFFKRCFPGRWEYEAHKYFDHGGTGREFVIMEEEDQIVGFCRINDAKSPIIAQNVYWSERYKGEQGGIGPLGIDKAYRKKGYGLAIVQAGIHFLQSRGAQHMVIDWTELVSFYEKWQFGVCDTFYQYEKSL